MASNFVPESGPEPNHSPFLYVSYVIVDAIEYSYVWFEFYKLKSTAIEFYNLLAFGRFSELIWFGRLFNGCIRLSFAHFAFPDEVRLSTTTTHLVHFLRILVDNFDNRCGSKYMSVYAYPVVMDFSTGRALHLEHIPEWIVLGILRPQIRDTVVILANDICDILSLG